MSQRRPGPHIPETGLLDCALCDWTGHDVGQHASKMHGVSSADYRRLYGPSVSPWLSGVRRRQYDRIDPFKRGRWTQELIIEALRAWAAERGTPRARDWRRTGEGRPCTSTVKNYFGSWSAAVEAAGLVPADRRRQTYCKRGHVPEETGRQADGSCTLCSRLRNHERYLRKREEIRAYRRERYAREQRAKGLTYTPVPKRRHPYRTRKYAALDS